MSAGGNEIALKEPRGRDVVVYFYPKDDTPGCAEAARGIVVLGVASEDAESHRKFAAACHLPFALLGAPDREAMAAYGARNTKVSYGKRRVGVIRSTV